MTKEEELQQKKDKWWEIYETETKIACMESRVIAAINAMQGVVKEWGAGRLEASGDRLVVAKGPGHNPEQLKAFPAYTELSEMVHDLTNERAKHKALKQEFDRMRR